MAIVYTSSTVSNTVTYLDLKQLEHYKKTFQSFWLPFMEQFIPATTIWVAGEKWCNEPCTIIDPCDYDFELNADDTSISQIPIKSTVPPTKPIKELTNQVPVQYKSETTAYARYSFTENTATTTRLVADVGLTTETIIEPGQLELVDKTFSDIIIEETVRQ